MKCSHCGTDFADGMMSCPNCGAPASPYGQPNSQPYMQGQPGPQPYMQGQPGPQPYMQGQPGPQPYMQGQPGPQPYMQGQPGPGGMGYAPYTMPKKEFMRLPHLSKWRAGIIAAAVISYLSAGVTFIASIAGILVMDVGIFALADVMLLIGLGLGIQLGKSRACAVILLIYAALSFIVGIISSGRPSGALVLFVSIYATISTFQLQKAWQEYQRTGMLP